MSTTFRSTRPPDSEYAPYYTPYISRVPDGDILAALKRQQFEIHEFLSKLTDEQAGSRYAPGKWSVREIVGHVTDAERIFAYRALRVGRNDKTPLPGFDEDEYVKHTDFDRRTLGDLTAHFSNVRTTTLDLFENFNEEAWLRTGTANNYPISVRSLAWIIAGHELHHREIIRTRYLKLG